MNDRMVFLKKFDEALDLHYKQQLLYMMKQKYTHKESMKILSPAYEQVNRKVKEMIKNPRPEIKENNKKFYL